MTGSEPMLIDSNILVYAYDASEKAKHPKAKEFIQERWQNSDAVLSIQNLVEFYSTITKKVSNPVSTEKAKQIILDYCEGFEIIKYNEKTIVEAINIEALYKIPFWDALVAATMQENNIYSIATENEQHFKKIGWIKTTNPLK